MKYATTTLVSVVFIIADVEFPSDDEVLDEDAEQLILSLLRKDPNSRLGAGGKPD